MISVILPTIRPHQYKETILSIVNGANGRPCEVIVIADFKFEESVSPLKGSGVKLKWIYDHERRGVINAINKGYAHAQGDYIFTLNDESLLYPGALERLEEFCYWNDDLVLASPCHIPPYPFYYYQKWFAPFPFAHRSLIENLCYDPTDGHYSKDKYFFDPTYRCFYADPDLSMKAYDQGYKVLECPDAVIVHSNDITRIDHRRNVDAYMEVDRLMFSTRWAHLGEFKDP